jgi:hypothetical protein
MNLISNLLPKLKAGPPVTSVRLNEVDVNEEQGPNFGTTVTAVPLHVISSTAQVPGKLIASDNVANTDPVPVYDTATFT